MPRILGIDPGSRVTGYGVVSFDGARLSYVECGVIRTSPKARLEDRLAEIARGVEEVIGELLPDVVAVEDVFYSVNARSALALGQARGAVLAIAGRAGLVVHAYAPALVKKAVTGRGRATKGQVTLMIKALLRLRQAPRADAADALAVAVAHAHIGRPA